MKRRDRGFRPNFNKLPQRENRGQYNGYRPNNNSYSSNNNRWPRRVIQPNAETDRNLVHFEE